jgi:hypothetical protein
MARIQRRNRLAAPRSSMVARFKASGDSAPAKEVKSFLEGCPIQSQRRSKRSPHVKPRTCSPRFHRRNRLAAPRSSMVARFKANGDSAPAKEVESFLEGCPIQSQRRSKRSPHVKPRTCSPRFHRRNRIASGPPRSSMVAQFKPTGDSAPAKEVESFLERCPIQSKHRFRCRGRVSEGWGQPNKLNRASAPWWLRQGPMNLPKRERAYRADSVWARSDRATGNLRHRSGIGDGQSGRVGGGATRHDELRRSPLRCAGHLCAAPVTSALRRRPSPHQGRHPCPLSRRARPTDPLNRFSRNPGALSAPFARRPNQTNSQFFARHRRPAFLDLIPDPQGPLAATPRTGLLAPQLLHGRPDDSPSARCAGIRHRRAGVHDHRARQGIREPRTVWPRESRVSRPVILLHFDPIRAHGARHTAPAEQI